MLHRIYSIILVLLLSLNASPAMASETFSMQRFQELQEKNALILVDVYASWCPTCTRQQEILDDYLAQRPDAELHILKIDFDKQKKWVRHFKAPRQSTFILYRGEQRIWFSVAETDKEVIFQRLDEAREAS